MIVADLLDREEQRTPVHWYDSVTIELCLTANSLVERWVLVIGFSQRHSGGGARWS
jgi:hypothetical protein